MLEQEEEKFKGIFNQHFKAYVECSEKTIVNEHHIYTFDLESFMPIFETIQPKTDAKIFPFVSFVVGQSVDLIFVMYKIEKSPEFTLQLKKSTTHIFYTMFESILKNIFYDQAYSKLKTASIISGFVFNIIKMYLA